jgi:hypothetical protein
VDLRLRDNQEHPLLLRLPPDSTDHRFKGRYSILWNPYLDPQLRLQMAIPTATLDLAQRRVTAELAVQDVEELENLLRFHGTMIVTVLQRNLEDAGGFPSEDPSMTPRSVPDPTKLVSLVVSKVKRKERDCGEVVRRRLDAAS